MASQTKGIQQLLAAEKGQEARQRKQRRLRQAKEEAEVEIEKFTANSERQLEEFEVKHLGSKQGAALRIEELKETVSTNSAKVIDDLLNIVYDITPQLHRNSYLQINGRTLQNEIWS